MTAGLTGRPAWAREPALTAKVGSYAFAACGAGLAFGTLLPIAPKTAIAWLATILLATTAPIWALSAIVAITVLVPYGVQDAFSVIGGQDRPSLVIVDVLMAIGLMRIAWSIARGRLKIDLPLLIGMFLTGICTIALVAGYVHGAKASAAGHEARGVMLGVGTFVLAWPLINDQTSRRRLVRVLIVIGLAVGVWGLAQWLFSIGHTGGDVGVRTNDEVSSPQLQGAMYAYPVAIAMSWAALISGQLRNASTKWLVAAILVINGICLVLTFERTMWVAAVLACLFVLCVSGSRARRVAVKWGVFAVPLLAAAAVLASAEARTVIERIGSFGRLEGDNSLKWRLAESHALVDAIGARPLSGSGFGATITWGVTNLFPTRTTTFAHVSPIWLAFKIGIPAAALVVLLLLWAVLRRCPTEDDPDWRILRQGSRAGVLALFIMSVAFPLFYAPSITAAMALLVAICYSRGSPVDVDSQWSGVRRDTG